MIPDREWAARNAARERHLSLTRSERETMWANLVVGTHTLMCSPLEVLPNGRVRRLDPGPILGPDCICRGYPLRYIGPNGLEDLRDAQVVSQATRIHTSRTKNISLERLLGRLEYLREYITRSREWAEQKEQFKARVREIVAVENELDRRHVVYRRVSRRVA